MHDTYSFVFDRQGARRVFKQIGEREMLLAVLARVPARSHWSGCRVYFGESPLGPDSVCVGIRGPAADAAQQELVAAFEQLGIPILQCFEGGPAVGQEVARAEAERWCGDESAV